MATLAAHCASRPGKLAKDSSRRRVSGPYNRCTDMRPSSNTRRGAAHCSSVALAVLTVCMLCAPGARGSDLLPQKTDRVSLSTAPPLTRLPSATASDALLPLADHLVLRKAERRLYLMHGESVLRTYHVALGLNPMGQKERSGDYRTPEGRYFLARRNPRSEYFLSIQVSYPNDADLKRARRHRWDAGGSIMIHGLPNELRRSPEYYERTDWTDGCIALSNSDMIEIWLMVPDHVPIDILP
jgi:L,D-transpeptidase catalytic domain